MILFLFLFFALFEDDVVVIDGDEPWKIELEDEGRKDDQDGVNHRDRQSDREPDVRTSCVHSKVAEDQEK